MNILKIKNQKSGGTLALFIKDSSLSVSESVSEKANLIRGDPPKIALKRRGSPLKTSIIRKIGKKYSLFRLNFIYFLAEFDLKLAIGQPKLVQND
jgi:hypothetical protein